MRDLELLLRKNILGLKPCSCARDEYKGKGTKALLDANENPYNEPLNRYPDPMQTELKKKLSPVKRVFPECIFLGNGSDEAVDLIYRCFAEPGIDNVVAIEPASDMYRFCADVNGVEYRMVELDADFQLSADRVLSACDGNTKVVWLCSPNDPTGNDLNRDEVARVLREFDGIVVVDEVYADFSKATPLRFELHKYPNLIVLDSFSKAWGCAGVRMGMAYAQPDIISVMNRVKHPYNVSSLALETISRQLDKRYDVDKWVNILLMERGRMIEAFKLLPTCEKVYPTDANFFLAKMTDVDLIYRFLMDNGIMVRNVSKVPMCSGCLRITVGSKAENSELLSLLRQFKGE